MFIAMIVVFVLGYTAIALEHPLKINKAASALLLGVLTWVIFILGGEEILKSGDVSFEKLMEYLSRFPKDDYIDYISHYEIIHHLGEISEILFFLLGAMTIVEIVDQHQGFKIITDKIKTTNKVRLLWILTFLTFFMSAALDNLTTTIVMVALLRKLIADQKTRWFFASMVILAANAGGAWSPIGDVTTIMLWVKGNVTTIPIIRDVFVPSVVTAVIPCIILTFSMKGNVTRPPVDEDAKEFTTVRERTFILILGVSSLLFVPVFKTITHLPPYMGMLFALGNLWVITEIMHRKKKGDDKRRLTVVGILTKVDVSTVLFFLGILLAVASLQSAGHLALLAGWLDDVTNQNIYIINLAIGGISAIVDNVPLVAGAMGMYEIESAAGSAFAQDGQFWQFLAYCAGTGGSMLIIGSAAGVAAMGMEKIDFIWYMKKISLLAMTGYLAGAGTYYLMFGM